VSEKPSLVSVEIFGQSYSLKAGADPGYVQQLASFVDNEMREVSRGGGTVDSVRIAVLAALNIADECLRLRNDVKDAEAKLQERAARLVGALDAALAD
jgi:cell division protein ZapA